VKFKTLRLLGLLIITPLTAFASGQYMMSMLLDFVIFIFAVAAIFGLDINWTGKLILFILYLATTSILLYIYHHQSPVGEQTLSGFEVAVIPPTITFVAYWLVRWLFKKSDT